MKQWIIPVLSILLLNFLFFNGGHDLRGATSIAGCLILSLGFDARDIVSVTDMEYLDPGPGLLDNHHHLLIGVRLDERSGVHLANEESFVLRRNLL